MSEEKTALQPEDKKAVEPAKERKPTMGVSLSPQGGLVPTDLDGLWRLASIMVASGFMPKEIKTTEAVFVAVQMGLEVGLSPMQAVQNIAVINGRPSLWGDAMIGLVEASGALEEFKEYFQGDYPKDDFRAVCVAKRKGHEAVIINEFSIGDAKLAGLWGKSGPWTAYPKRMLKMRARGFTLRDGFADKLKGLKSAEELLDTPAEEFEIQTMANKQLIDIEPEKQEAKPVNGDAQAHGPTVDLPKEAETTHAEQPQEAAAAGPGF